MNEGHPGMLFHDSQLPLGRAVYDQFRQSLPGGKSLTTWDALPDESKAAWIDAGSIAIENALNNGVMGFTMCPCCESKAKDAAERVHSMCVAIENGDSFPAELVDLRADIGELSSFVTSMFKPDGGVNVATIQPDPEMN